MNTKLSTTLGTLVTIIFSLYAFIDLEVFKAQTFNDFYFGAIISLALGVFFGLLVWWIISEIQTWINKKYKAVK